MAVKSKYSKDKSYKVVAFCVSCFAGDEQARLMQAAQKISEEHNIKVVFFSTISDFYYDDVNDAGEKKIFDALSVELFDGIVVMAESFKKEKDMLAMIERAKEVGVPVLSVDRYIPSCINLRYDYGDSFKQVVRHMVEYHGYRDVNFLGGWEDNAYSDERMQAYREVLEENGIPFEPKKIYYGGFWEEPAREAMEQMVAEGPLPRAIICANDSMALAVSSWLKERGYQVPQDVAVSGFDGIIMERYYRPRLTTALSNYEGMLHRVFEIVEQGEAPGGNQDSLVIYNKIQIGSSCGCQELEPIDPGAEMVSLKNQLYLEMRFHEFMNQMVANQGNAEDLREVIRSIPEHMHLMQYEKCWVCLNDKFVNYMKTPGEAEWEDDTQGKVYSDTLTVFAYAPQETDAEICHISFGELIPDLSKVLEKDHSLMVVPLHLKGDVIGYVAVQFQAQEFTYTLYSSFIVNLRYVLEMQKNRVRLADVYLRDSLSGLYNRNGFYHAINRVLQRDQELDLAILSIDMDHLKMINDTYGHGEGDVALLHMAKVMECVVEPGEIAARIGGDEFLVALSGAQVEERAEIIKLSLQEVLAQYNKVSGKPYALQASIGVYTNRIKGHSLDHFLKKADSLMYAEKYLHRRQNSGGVISN